MPVSNFLQRTFTGIAIVMIIMASIVAGPYFFFLLCLLINVLGITEFYRLFHALVKLPGNLIAMLLSVTLFFTLITIITGFCDWRILLLNIFPGAAIFIAELYLPGENPFQRIAILFFGILYISVPLLLLLSLPFVPLTENSYHPFIIAGYFVLLWTNDTSAYLFGTKFGRHPLFKRISPGKTWEGSIGGGLSCLLTAFMISVFSTELSLTDWMTIAVIVIIMGTFGDLVKSLLKRSLNIKDSGYILPGHGGILDRFDSLIGSVPFVFGYLVLTLDH